ncbi:PfkB family carbohydrate kinase [Streptomyces sp. NPDC058676]|uniref:PfkB family carbohydrate kinase n=1 Tax=unclassified Streptomyces TaxID=2593676 RepID=UPI00365DEF5D
MTISGPRNAPDVVDVVALGESMVTFLPSRPGRLADVPSFDRAIGGAESNLACVLAAAGHSVRWVSRVGADAFGAHLTDTIGEYGVDVSAVHRDPARPTGIYFRTAGDRSTDAHEVAYYRAGSAASAMTVDNVDPVPVRAGRILHLSGITAALSEGCLTLLRELTARRPGRPLVSFDVNHRAGLWQDTEGPRVLLELARGADIVFVGEDEAEEAWGVKGGPPAIRSLLPEPAVLVVKEGARGATVFERGGGSGDEVARDAQLPLPAGERAAQLPLPAGEGGVQSFRASAGEGGVQSARSPADASGARSAEGDASCASGRATQPSAAAVAGVVPAESAPPRLSAPCDALSDRSPADASGARSAEGDASYASGRAAQPSAAPAGSTPAHRSVPDTVTFVPALDVDVVAPTGAGDAFAAGFLSATLRGLALRVRLRHGHLWAAATLTAPGDLAPPPTRDHADGLAGLDDDAWGRLRLGPGWTQAAQRAEEEVRTP